MGIMRDLCGRRSDRHGQHLHFPFYSSPSVDGASRDFYISGSAYTNGLWWYKVGANNASIALWE